MHSRMKIFLAATAISTLFIGPLHSRSQLEASRDYLARVEAKRPKPQDYYNGAIKAFEEADFDSVVKNSDGLFQNYPLSILAAETRYMQAISYFNMGELHLADQALTHYLNDYSTLKHFEEAISHKFEIAQRYHEGERKRLFGGRHSPKWLSGKEDAVRLYDEVITTLPRHDLAAQSMFHKGNLLVSLESYKEAIESYQKLIRRFPKHPLAPESYLAIGQAYISQCENEFPDPNLIELAELNLRKFTEDFPGESRLADMGDMLQKIKENFAQDLYKNGRYYERKKKEKAAFLYYVSILQKYPTTEHAKKAEQRVAHLKKRSKNPDDLQI